jgi:phage-related tail protein
LALVKKNEELHNYVSKLERILEERVIENKEILAHTEQVYEAFHKAERLVKERDDYIRELERRQRASEQYISEQSGLINSVEKLVCQKDVAISELGLSLAERADENLALVKKNEELHNYVSKLERILEERVIENKEILVNTEKVYDALRNAESLVKERDDYIAKLERELNAFVR